MNTLINSHVNFPVVKVVHNAPGLSQKKEVSPGAAGCCQKEYKLKYVKGVSCVTQLSCVKHVTNVKNLVAGPKVVQILREGYTLHFWIRPKLTRSPTIISCYANPHMNLYLVEALHQLMDKNTVELVQNKKSQHFFNRLFLVPKLVETYTRSEQFKPIPQGSEPPSSKGSGLPQSISRMPTSTSQYRNSLGNI